ncbi:efflux RND transporter periplasmic adaptor subunit [Sulfuriflexus mobilis]|uniref:efflux RND transporter periplasmic adaptor subunit n=1 Tax=Sulfuriflexus mobilis TaxID=1811807 RepID=UPI000F82A231|nr:efflux RND transporter periplasmic adaptor subunit [Sulfuriflexus mobilis]
MKSGNTKFLQLFWTVSFAILLSACGVSDNEPKSSMAGEHGAETEIEVEKGPHGGRMLHSGDFSLELSIFETGVPPEFRAWAKNEGRLLTPDEVDLKIKLIRLGNKIDDIGFEPHGDALRGDTVIYEPHSFVVNIIALHKGVTHSWEYDNFEGRTMIEPKVAEALAIGTSVAEAGVIKEIVTVYGKIVGDSERMRDVSARFDGQIKSVAPSIGDTVKKGQLLARVESNESLKIYNINAPISGVITHRNANPGEQTNGRNLFTIMDTSSVWANLSIFPSDRTRVRIGAPVRITTAIGGQVFDGVIDRINVMTEVNQAVTARVVLDNKEGRLLPGSFVSADIEIAMHSVDLAVKRTGLQAFRDFTVVYAKIGDEYEVRMLELGRQDGEWVEVLGGLEPGTRYVSDNSYIIKADIEKSGASHDH